MKKLLLVAALGCLGFTASAQAPIEGKNQIILNIGLANPTGDFKSTNIEDESGFAEVGGNMSVSYARRLSKMFSVGATLGKRNNSVNAQAISDEYDADVKAGPWGTTYLLSDFYLNLPWTNKLNLYGKASLGTAINKSMSLEMRNENVEMQLSSANASSVAYGFAAGITYSLGRVNLGIETGVLSTKPEFEMEMNGETDTFKQPMTTNNLSIRIGYSF